MDIGRAIEEIVVEPIESPVPETIPVPAALPADPLQAEG